VAVEVPRSSDAVFSFSSDSRNSSIFFEDWSEKGHLNRDDDERPEFLSDDRLDDDNRGMLYFSTESFP
jgi:hypothetical protein